MPGAKSFKSDEFIKGLQAPGNINPFTEALSAVSLGGISFGNQAKFASNFLNLGGERVSDTMRGKLQEYDLESFIPENQRVTIGLRQVFENLQDLENFRNQVNSQISKAGFDEANFDKTFSGNLQNTVNQVEEIDKKLQGLGRTRSELSAENTPEAKNEIREIDAEMRSLLKERKEITFDLQINFDAVENQKKVAESLRESFANDPTIPSAVKANYLKILDEVIKKTDELSKKLKDAGLDKALKPLENKFTAIVDTLTKADREYEKFLRKLNQEEAQKKIGIYENQNLQGNAFNQALTRTSLDTDTAKLGRLMIDLKMKQEKFKELTSIVGVDTPKSSERGKEVAARREELNKTQAEVDQLRVRIAQ